MSKALSKIKSKIVKYPFVSHWLILLSVLILCETSQQLGGHVYTIHSLWEDPWQFKVAMDYLQYSFLIIELIIPRISISVVFLFVTLIYVLVDFLHNKFPFLKRVLIPLLLIKIMTITLPVIISLLIAWLFDMIELIFSSINLERVYPGFEVLYWQLFVLSIVVGLVLLVFYRKKAYNFIRGKRATV
ncbi:MAG: hypothetical protein ACYSUK_08990 [Planctomycetota bacterium]|jgi:hypothetical protein